VTALTALTLSQRTFLLLIFLGESMEFFHQSSGQILATIRAIHSVERVE
jgi:hypothetical protein